MNKPQGHGTAGRITYNEKINYLIGIRTRDLPACTITPQPSTLNQRKHITSPLRAQEVNAIYRFVTVVY
jgi:hypothetical protein